MLQNCCRFVEKHCVSVSSVQCGLRLTKNACSKEHDSCIFRVEVSGFSERSVCVGRRFLTQCTGGGLRQPRERFSSDLPKFHSLPHWRWTEFFAPKRRQNSYHQRLSQHPKIREGASSIRGESMWNFWCSRWYSADFLYIWYDMIHLLTAIRLTPGGGSTIHIYTQYIEQRN